MPAPRGRPTVTAPTLALLAAALFAAACAELLTYIPLPPVDTGEGGGSPPGGSAPGQWPVVYARQGVFHRPTRGKTTRRFDIPVAEGVELGRVTVDLDVTHGGWFAADAAKNHAIFWLQRGQRWGGNVVGYVNAFGPPRSELRLATNLGSGSNMRTGKARVRLGPGRTYHVRYVYEVAAGRMEVVTTSGGRQVARATAQPATRRLRTVEPRFFVVFGHSATSRGPERPTYDWSYADLRIELHRR